MIFQVRADPAAGPRLGVPPDRRGGEPGEGRVQRDVHLPEDGGAGVSLTAGAHSSPRQALGCQAHPGRALQAGPGDQAEAERLHGGDQLCPQGSQRIKKK